MCGKICMPKDEFPARSNSPGGLSESASFLTARLGQFTPRGETSETCQTNFLGQCVHFSPTKGNGLFRGRLNGRHEKERSPRSSDCIVPVSMEDEERVAVSCYIPTLIQELGVSPEAPETCCYLCSRSSSGSAKQWGLFYSLRNSSRFCSQHKRALYNNQKDFQKYQNGYLVRRQEGKVRLDIEKKN